MFSIVTNIWRFYTSRVIFYYVQKPLKLNPNWLCSPSLDDSVSLLLLVLRLSSSTPSPFIRKIPRTSLVDIAARTSWCKTINDVDGDGASPAKFGVDATDFKGLRPRFAPWMSARPLFMTIWKSDSKWFIFPL